MWVFRLENEIRKRREEEIRWNGGQIRGKKVAKAAERQRRAEEARCQEEEAKRRAGEEQERRCVEAEEKRKGEKEKLKHEKCPWQRCFKRQTLSVEFEIGGISYWAQRWRAVRPWVDTASRKCLTYPLWLTSVSWDRWRSHEGDNLGRVCGWALLWLHLLV